MFEHLCGVSMHQLQKLVFKIGSSDLKYLGVKCISSTTSLMKYKQNKTSKNISVAVLQ